MLKNDHETVSKLFKEFEELGEVREAVGRNDLGEVGDQMEAAKSDAPGRPDPSE